MASSTHPHYPFTPSKPHHPTPHTHFHKHPPKPHKSSSVFSSSSSSSSSAPSPNPNIATAASPSSSSSSSSSSSPSSPCPSPQNPILDPNSPMPLMLGPVEQGKLLTAAVGELGKMGRPDLVHQVFDGGLAAGYGNTVFAHSALIRAYARSGLAADAMAVLDSMKS